MKTLAQALRRPIRSLRNRAAMLSYPKDEMTPPKWMVFVGHGDFREVGDAFLQYFKDAGGLQPHERVLDVGCGIGRIAVALTQYLDARGGYEGFDVVAEGINWCRKRITPKYPNFHFQRVDIYNNSYNRKGKIKASEFRFPYEDASFDFVILTSVFTHMLPEDMDHYFSEIARVMRPGARCFITYFLANSEALELMRAGKGMMDFKHDCGAYLTINPEKPEDAVCYDEAYIAGFHEKHGLKIRRPIHYGFWSGREKILTYQDVIVAEKK